MILKLKEKKLSAYMSPTQIHYYNFCTYMYTCKHMFSLNIFFNYPWVTEKDTMKKYV